MVGIETSTSSRQFEKRSSDRSDTTIDTSGRSSSERENDSNASDLQISVVDQSTLSNEAEDEFLKCMICLDGGPPPEVPLIRVCNCFNVRGDRVFKCKKRSDFKTLSCGHVYHRVCIHRWWFEADKLRQTRSCPVCKQKMKIRIHNWLWKVLCRRNRADYVLCFLFSIMAISIMVLGWCGWNIYCMLEQDCVMLPPGMERTRYYQNGTKA